MDGGWWWGGHRAEEGTLVPGVLQNSALQWNTFQQDMIKLSIADIAISIYL